ncbi:unnamed protein product [Rhizophagus irregularis]|nr:unnamed protein product [Rhizophagus irregularis]
MAFQLYEKAAKNRNDDALCKLGLLYETGEGINKNEKKAFQLIKELAEKDHINAMFILGDYYKKGIGTKKDKHRAFQLYKEAAEYGNNDALYELSLLYESGEGVNKNEEMAFKLIKKLAEEDYIKAFSKLEWYYYKGIGTEINTKKAIELRDIDVMMKSNETQHKISLLVRDLKGIDVEEERAFKLLFALAVKEYKDAQFILEYYHKKGIKNSINVLKALELYNKILEKYIDSDAQNKLKLLCRLWEGNIFYEVVKNNRKNEKQTTNMNKILLIIVALILCLSFFISNYGLTKNIEDKFALEKHDIKFYNLAQYYIKKDARRAFKYYKGSAKKGHSKALFKLGMCYHFGIGTKIHKKKAFHLYTKSTISAKEGHNVAQYELSILYETGEGVNKDEKKSFEIIEELANKGDVSAQHRLGYYYEKGIGTDVNILKALELYHTAAENGITEAIKSSSSLLFKLGEKIIKGETKAFEIVELYQTAKDNGNLKAIMSLERLLYELGDKRKAFDIVKELADKGYANAQHRLGYYYEKGIGTHINILKARELYTMAVINENVEALKSLNDLISNHGT